jgi:Kef-type K+ transport system membrane component KefB
MVWLDAIRSHLAALPSLAKFAVVMAIILGVPTLARCLRIPALIVFLIFGVLLGPHVLGVYGTDHPVVRFFADLGKLLLTFTAGLEINIDLFRRAQTRSIAFGFITVPQVLGTAFGLAFGYSTIQAIVIGSLLASHTLVSLPIVAHLGAVRLEPVVVAIGATVVSDMLSLVIFGICVSTYTTGFSQSALAVQVVEVMIFVPLILFGASSAGAWLLGNLRDNEEGYFAAMLGIMIASGVLADVINLPGIVGVFLAGLSVNAAVGDHPAKEKLKFFGKGAVRPDLFHCHGLSDCACPVRASCLGQFFAGREHRNRFDCRKGSGPFLAGRAFGYSREAKLEMWALTLPQVAATLAATLVGYETLNEARVRLLDEKLVNAVLVLLVVTSILGPVLTELFTPGMVKQEAAAKADVA